MRHTIVVQQTSVHFANRSTNTSSMRHLQVNLTDVLRWPNASKSICVPVFFVKREDIRIYIYTELKVILYFLLQRKDGYVSTSI